MKHITNNFKNIYMKTRRIEVRKPIIEDKTANQIIFGCSRIVGVPVITETALLFVGKV